MKQPNVPHNEQKRLENLNSYRVLDTLPETAYDDLVRLTAMMCDVPIVAVSLIDEKRQWFKAIKGLQTSETAREISFCGHAILNPEEMMIVEDASLDERFIGNPLVTGDPKIRFYAGMPLISEAGYALGTLCVIDRKPRILSPMQQTALTVLTSCVMNLLEHDKNIDALNEQQKRLCDSFQEKEEFIQKLLQKNHELEVFSRATTKDLREPLEKIKNHGLLLKKEAEHMLSETALEHLDVMTVSAICGQNILKELNNLIEPGMSFKERFEIIDMNKLVKNVALYFQGNTKNEAIQISFGLLPKIYSHLGSVTGIFHHVIQNAIKFQPAGQTAKIQIIADKKGDFWQFSVIDNGIGLDKNNFETIFKPFIKLHGDTYEGAGIGLSLVSNYAKSLEGDIKVDSTGKGSVFFIMLPSKLA